MSNSLGSRWQDAVQHLLDVHRPQQAEQLARQQLVQHPREMLAYLLLSLALYRQGRLAEARAVAEEALVLDPAESDAFYLLALIDSRSGEPAASLRAIDEALSLQPSNPKYLGLLAHLLLHQSQPAAAQVAAERGLAQNPTHLECLVTRATALKAQQHWPQLAEALHGLGAAYPNHPAAHRLLGHEALRQQQFAAAQQHYQETLRLTPQDPEALHGASQAIRRQLWPGRFAQWLDNYMTPLTKATERGEWRAWGEFLVLVLPLLVVFCLPLLLFLGVEALYWRLHPAVRRLRNRPDQTASYAYQSLHRYSLVAALVLLAAAGLVSLGHLLLAVGLPRSAISAGLVWGLILAFRTLIESLQDAAPRRADTASVGWLGLALLVLAASLTAAFRAGGNIYASLGLLLLAAGLLYVCVRRQLAA